MYSLMYWIGLLTTAGQWRNYRISLDSFNAKRIKKFLPPCDSIVCSSFSVTVSHYIWLEVTLEKNFMKVFIKIKGCLRFINLLSYQGCTGSEASPTCLQTDTWSEDLVSAGNQEHSDNAQLHWSHIAVELSQIWRHFGLWVVDHMRLSEDLRRVLIKQWELCC